MKYWSRFEVNCSRAYEKWFVHGRGSYGCDYFWLRNILFHTAVFIIVHFNITFLTSGTTQTPRASRSFVSIYFCRGLKFDRITAKNSHLCYFVTLFYRVRVFIVSVLQAHEQIASVIVVNYFWTSGNFYSINSGEAGSVKNLHHPTFAHF